MNFANMNDAQKQMFLQQALRQQMIAQQMQLGLNNKAVLTPEQKAVQNQLRKDPKETGDLFIVLRVTNNNAFTVPVLLFDATDAFALKNNYTLPPGVTIECDTYNGGGSAGYQSLINDIATGTVLFFDQLNLECSVQAQFNQGIDLYSDYAKTSNVTLYDTIYPARGRNSMQQQLSMVEVPYNWKINRRSSMYYNQFGNSVFQMRFFASLEIASSL